MAFSQLEMSELDNTHIAEGLSLPSCVDGVATHSFELNCKIASLMGQGK
jgi:hypothetical protein